MGVWDKRIGLAAAVLLALLLTGCGEEEGGGGDRITPAPVTDLAISSTDRTSVTLAWTAVGDDGSDGTASVYDLRYADSLITEANWAEAFPVTGERAPQRAGRPETFTVIGLETGRSHSFALKVGDEEPNWSDLSNVIVAAAIPQEGGDQNWWDGFQYVGMNGAVYALEVFEGLLIAGGAFTEVGGVPAERIAGWNGLGWTPLGSGISSEVWALASYDGRLIAGGSFTRAGGADARYVAQWDGSDWSGLGPGANHLVLALTVWRGELIAGGLFTKIGGAAADYLARWDGSAWHPIPGFDGPVYSLIDYQGDLIAGGRFARAGETVVNQIARWDGTAWHPLGSGLFVSPPSPSASALAVHDGLLVVGGYFSSAGDLPASGIARWDGSLWGPVGAGMNDEVLSLLSFGGLVAAGRFTGVGDLPAHRIARWDGTVWRALASGIGPDDFSIVYALAEYQGSLYVGGSFGTAGGKESPNIARWDD